MADGTDPLAMMSSGTPDPTAPPPIDPNTDPELHAAAVHHGRLADTLNSVASILGGNKTLHLQKNNDGSVSVTQTDATPGEKWGRVAQAALSGAAKGFAAGQGPGGEARAAATGVATGMAMPQAQQDQTMAMADKYNDQNRARLLFNANMAMLDQKLIASKNENQRSGVIFGQQVQDNNLQYVKTMRELGATKVGHFKNNNDLALQMTNPDWMKAHLGTNGTAMQNNTYNPDRTLDGIDAWILPEDNRNKTNDKAITLPRLKSDPDNPGKLVDDTPYVIDAHSMTGEKVAATIKLLQDGQNTLVRNAWDARTKDREATLKENESQSLINQREAAAGASRAEAGLHGAQSEALRRQMTGEDQAAAGGPIGSQFGPSFETLAQKIADGSQPLSTLKIQRGKGLPTYADYVARADQIDKTRGGQGIDPGKINEEYKFALDQKNHNVLTAIERLVGTNGAPGQLDRLLPAATNAHLSNLPLVGGWLNEHVNIPARTKTNDPAMSAYDSLIKSTQADVEQAIGNPTLGSSNNKEKIRRAAEIIGSYPTPDVLKSQIQVIKDTLASEHGAITGSNRYMRNSSQPLTPSGSVPANTPAVQPGPTPTPSPGGGGGAPPASAVPLGHRTTFSNGQTWQNINGQITQVNP